MQPWEDNTPTPVAAPAPVLGKPWEDVPSSPMPATPTGFPEPQSTDNPPAGAEKPIEQRLAENAVRVGQAATAGFGLGSLASAGAQGLTSFFEAPESLKSAGITARTLENMAPGGQNPADYAGAVEKQLGGQGILANTAKNTWNNLSGKIENAGKTIGDTLNTIKQASPDALMVDAKSVLDPIANEALTRSSGLFSATANSANPFFQAYDGLMKVAQQQAGKLTLDNVNAALQETGKMMDEGGEDTQAIFGKLYGKLADARDTIVNTVAQQSNNPELASTLLKNNADYSTYMRILPSIEKAAYKEAIKEGVSAYQKYIGPLGQKMAIAGGTYALARGVVDKILGTGR